MEIKVTVELGEKTVALLNNLTRSVVKAPSQEPANEDAAVGKTEAVEDKPAPTRKRRTAAEIEADKKAAEAKEVAPEVEKKPEAAPEFSDLDADAQLEAIKAEVTRHTKKGKSADVKAMLAYFDAGRASELAEDQYEDFYNMVKEYAAGKSVNDLTSLD